MKLFALSALLLASRLFAAPATYAIDPAHTTAQFSVRHLMISNVRGTFQNVTGSAVYDPDNLAASKLEAVIDVNSVNTQQAKRDAHLKSPDFFDAAKYPTMTFRSKRFEKTSSGLRISGEFTLHGVTKEVVLQVEGPSPEMKDRGAIRIGASATTKINRKEFGLNYNAAVEGGGGFVVGDEITITLDVELVRK